jgi:hypothetical protein
VIAADLSLQAELLWLSIDPAHGGLPPRVGRRQLRKALAAASLVEAPDGRSKLARGRRSARSARRELLEAGLVEPQLRPRGLRLTDRAPAGRRFRDLWDAIEADELTSDRDIQLAVLLASSGALAARLTHHEQWIAWRRLKALMATGESGTWSAGPTSRPPLTQGIAALGAVALRGLEGLAHDALHDLGHSAFGGHSSGHHHGGALDGGHDHAGHHDGGQFTNGG